MAEVGKMAMNLVDQPGHMNCEGDLLVSRAHPQRSYLLTKTRGNGSAAVRCSNGSSGGPRMPYQDAPQLSVDESACLEWWVNAIAGVSDGG